MSLLDNQNLVSLPDGAETMSNHKRGSSFHKAA
jgi:hypothetical protein